MVLKEEKYLFIQKSVITYITLSQEKITFRTTNYIRNKTKIQAMMIFCVLLLHVQITKYKYLSRKHFSPRLVLLVWLLDSWQLLGPINKCTWVLNRLFLNSCKQRHQLDASVDKMQWFVWNCPPKPHPHFVMFAHWNVMWQKSFISAFLGQQIWKLFSYVHSVNL